MSFSLPPVGCCRCQCDSSVIVNINGGSGGGGSGALGGVDPPEGLVVADEYSEYLQYNIHVGGDTAKLFKKLPGTNGTPYGWAEYFNWAGT